LVVRADEDDLDRRGRNARVASSRGARACAALSQLRKARLRDARTELPPQRVHGRDRPRADGAAAGDRALEERGCAPARRPRASVKAAASRWDGLRALQGDRVRADRALDGQGLRRAVPSRARVRRRPSELRLDRGEPLVRAALLPARRRGVGDAMRVLVTGGAGFIGSHVVDRLQARGHEPRIFDLVPSPYHGPEIDTVLGDICDPAAARRAIDGCDAVMHLAAMADVDKVATDPTRTDHVNVRGTQVLLEASRDARVQRFVFASTIWVYGDAVAPDALDEDAELGLPKHFYTATKIAGEMYTATYGELYGLEWTILRFGIPYGPRA